MTAPYDIKAYDRSSLESVLAESGQPLFRARQLLRWIWQRRATSFDGMTDLPSTLRAALAQRHVLFWPALVAREVSSDGTRKYLWRLADGASVESVGIPTRGRLTVCFSTQVGCGMGCAFCATGRGGLVRNLDCGEMAAQVALVADDFAARVTNAVAMGQGEPFVNYDETIRALRILNDPDALGIGARHLTVSTSGVVPGIRRFATEPEQFTLAVSLHSAVQSTRDAIMPGLRTYPLSALHEALGDYIAKTGRRPTLEFALIDGVNDTPEETRALIAFCRGLLVHVNLIPVNPVDGTRLRRSRDATIEAMASALRAADVEVSVRAERGADINAACGQLRQRTPREA